MHLLKVSTISVSTISQTNKKQSNINFRTTRTMESHSSNPNSLIFVFNLLVHRIVFVGLLGIIRIEMTKGNLSAFELNGNGMFMIIAIVTLLVVEIVTWTLFCTNTYSHPSTRDSSYTILKFIGSFAMFLAPFSLVMVLVLPQKHDRVVYLVVSLILGVIFASFFSDDYQDRKRSAMPTFNYLGLVLVPVSLVLVLFVPFSLNWIVYAMIYSSIAIENVYNIIAYVKSRTENN
ncbi:hypothetical protein M8C21_028719 [Ambrosia artemisiifolia]|uniref:Uncharacterized protein n=1 Tax=Ambrosia artemisiifolia TaxID=4212 RepID=A0AAD5C0F5_AMBAR|nr:hypothetical protein M8C21_028719 [Ambrosia artemisiifolia]